MDAVTLTFVCCILVQNTVLGKPYVIDTASFILKAPDNDTGTWMWKTDNSKVSFRHFHHVGDNPGNGYWTLEVTHSETHPRKSQKVTEINPGSISTNFFDKLPYIMLVNAPPDNADVIQQQKELITTEFATEEEQPAAELQKEFFKAFDATGERSKENEESQSLIETNSNEDVKESIMETVSENDEVEIQEENWWLPGEDLVDEEEDGYFHVRDVIRVKLYSLRKDWEEARQKCRRDGGDLAVPDTVTKAHVIRKLLRRYPEIPASAVLRNQVYVGIHDPLRHREWITVKGEGFTQKFWASGEPDNESPGEDCVTFRTDGRIRDVPCFYSLPFVCEKPLPFLEQLE